jgi:hypothetical protein
MVEALRNPVDDRDDGVAGGNRERATRTKIVLNIDNEQHIVAGAGQHLRQDPATAAPVRVSTG